MSKPFFICLSDAIVAFSDLAEKVRAGAEAVITKGGDPYIAIIDSRRLKYYQQLERERIESLLAEEASKGIEDIKGERVLVASEMLSSIKKRPDAN